MAIEGTLDLFQLPEILQVISQQGKTGILTVQGERDIIAISFLNGQVVAADALNQTLEEALGEVLASQGLVSPADFAGVAGEHQAGGGRLIDLLVDRGLVDRGQLLAAMRHQTSHLVCDLLAWREGDFKFYSGDEVSFEEGFVPISVEELLIRSVEDASGDGNPSIPDSRSLYERVETERPVRVRREGEEPGSEDAVWITLADKEVLDHLNGGRTVAALVKATGSNEYKVRYGLHRLLDLGLARRAGTATRAAPVRPGGPQRQAALQRGSVAAGAPSAPRPVAPVEAPAPRPSPPARPVELELPSLEPADLRSGARTGPPPRWLGWVLAVVPFLGLFLWSGLAPLFLTLPFPWQDTQRSGLEKEVRSTIFQKIDQAAKTHFLLEGEFPPGLEELVAVGLLSAAEERDALGRPLAYSPSEYSYVVQPVAGGEPVTSSASTEAVTGNFLLDPDFILLPDNLDEQPLVLLD